MVTGQKTLLTLSLAILFLLLSQRTVFAGTSGEISGKALEGSNIGSLSGMEISFPSDSTVSSCSDNGDIAIDVPAGGSVAKARKSGHRNSAIKEVSSWTDLQMQPLRGGLEAYGKEGSGITNIQMEPFATEHITSESIERMPVSDIEDILANQVGVVRMWRSGYEGLYFHGGQRDEVIYLLDGVDVTDPFSHSLGVTLDKDAISQISLYPGWFPAEYGEAMSVVVDITTKDETDRYKGTIEYGSDGILKDEANHLGYNRVRFNLGGPLPTAFRSCFFLSGNLWDVDNWSPGILSKPHNDKDQKNILAKLNFRPLNNLRLTVGGNWAQEKYHLYDHQRSRGNWLKDGPLYEDGNSLVYLSLAHSLSRNVSYTLNLSKQRTYSRYSSQDGRDYHDFKAIGPGLHWVQTAIDSGWYDQENDSWKPGFDPDSVWLWYYTQEGWYHPTTDTSEAHWESVVQKQETYNRRWYNTGFWEINEDSTDIFYVPFDLDGYLREVHEDSLHRSGLYQGDIDQFFPNYDEYAQFEYDFVPWWYRQNSTRYAANFALTCRIGNYNQLKAGFSYRKDYLKLTDIQFLNANPYSDYYDKRPVEVAAYLQDEFKYNELTLNAGLRYDHFRPKTKGDAISHSERRWSPRLGIAFAVFDNTLLYANYGRFSQVVHLVGASDKTIIYEAGIKHTFTSGLAGQVTGYYKRKSYYTYLYSIIFPSQNASYTVYKIKNSAKIKGIDLTITKRASRYLSGSIGYSYLDAQGTGPAYWMRWYLYSGTNLIEYPLQSDVTHSCKANLNLYLPEGCGPRLLGFKPLSDFNTNLQFTYYTGAPYTPLDSHGNPGIPNSVRLPSTQQTDLKIVKGFKIAGGLRCGLFLDVRNLFNVENVVNVYPYSGKPDDNGYPPLLEGYGYDYEAWGKAYKVWQRRQRNPANYGIPRIVRMGIWVKL